MKLLITGSRGFVGHSLSVALLNAGYECVLHQSERRSSYNEQSNKVSYDTVRADLTATTNWRHALQGCDCVVHCAALTEGAGITHTLADYRAVNTAGTLNLARQAAQAGVKRFIFLSSIKVHGNESVTGRPLTTAVSLVPTDPYGLSKYEAEQELLALAERSSMAVVIIRPPLVYGPQVKANFAALLTLVDRGWPIPSAGIKNNRRSMVSLDNLIDLMITCMHHPAAVNQVFMVSDDEDLSTAELINKLSNACGRRNWLFSISPQLLQSVARLCGKNDMMRRLTGSLHVDISYTKARLNWTPVMSVDAGFKKTADAILRNKQRVC